MKIYKVTNSSLIKPTMPPILRDSNLAMMKMVRISEINSSMTNSPKMESQTSLMKIKWTTKIKKIWANTIKNSKTCSMISTILPNIQKKRKKP